LRLSSGEASTDAETGVGGGGLEPGRPRVENGETPSGDSEDSEL